MRKLAWLNATPEGAKSSRRESYEKANSDSSFLKLPDCDGAEYIITMLFEAGTMSQSGMGVYPLTWQEIESWLRVTGTRAEVWERLLIKELSHAYVVQLYEAKEKDCPVPYMPEAPVEEIDREAVANKLLGALRSMKRKQPENS